MELVRGTTLQTLVSNMGLEGVNQEEDIPRCSTPVGRAPTAFDISIGSVGTDGTVPDLFEWPDNFFDDDHDLLPDNWELPTCGINCSCSCCPVGECDTCSDCRCRDSAPHESDLDTTSTHPGSISGGGRQDSPVLFSNISFMSEGENSRDSLVAFGGSPISSCNTSMSESLLRSVEQPQPAWRPLPPFLPLQEWPAVDSLPDSPDSPSASSCHSWAPATFSPESPDASFSSVSSQEVGDEEEQQDGSPEA